MLLDKISDAWLQTIKEYFIENGNPWDWFVFKENDDEGNVDWGIGGTGPDDDEKLLACDDFDQARVILACMVFGYEIVSGEVITIKSPEGEYVVGESGKA
jgi:hypothetical protein